MKYFLEARIIDIRNPIRRLFYPLGDDFPLDHFVNGCCKIEIEHDILIEYDQKIFSIKFRPESNRLYLILRIDIIKEGYQDSESCVEFLKAIGFVDFIPPSQ